jgi:hypothetical protein
VEAARTATCIEIQPVGPLRGESLAACSRRAEGDARVLLACSEALKARAQVAADVIKSGGGEAAITALGEALKIGELGVSKAAASGGRVRSVHELIWC